GGLSSVDLLAALTVSKSVHNCSRAKLALRELGQQSLLPLRQGLRQTPVDGPEEGAYAAALGALRDVGAPAAGSLVDRLLEYDGRKGKCGVPALAAALQSIGPEAAPQVLRLLESAELRESGLVILRGYGVESVPHLEASAAKLAESSPELSEQMSQVVWSIRHEDGLPPPMNFAPWPDADFNLKLERPGAIAFLDKEIQDLALMGMTYGQAVKAMRAHLRGRDYYLRRMAARGLSRLGPGSAEALPELTEALGDKDPQLRWVACDALGSMGPAAEPAVPGLVQLLGKEELIESQVRAIEALRRIGPGAREAVPGLIELLEPVPESVHDFDDVHRPRRAAALALAYIEPVRAIEPLAELLDDPLWAVRRTAADALAVCGPAASDVLGRAIETGTPRERRYAALALFKMGLQSPDAYYVLAESAPDSDAVTQWMVAQAEAKVSEDW
ncbi:HEAT repeat domain-containing protein, partial [Candidatus Poribacteria bacterium]|nr:HEAT repeat domain-containing protein [Candidatus Poribacteria bacterium]